jgi:DNA mismatch endonuclease, patch repair protein
VLQPSYTDLQPSSARASKAARASSRKTGTRCELLLRRSLAELGACFRVNVSTLPGCPDLVFPEARVAVFCDGDFWHGRNWASRRARLEDGSNAEYWIAKIERNRLRDWQTTSRFLEAAWTVLRPWESEILADSHRVARVILGVVRAKLDIATEVA